MTNPLSRELSLRVDRFMRLPRRSADVWQGGGVLLPFFLADADTGQPTRQAAIAWANLATDDVLLVEATPEEAADPTRVLEAFLDLGLKNRKVREGRPARIEVRDGRLGAVIKEALRDGELDVAILPSLPRIEAEVERIVEAETSDRKVPGVLDTPGMTLERLRAFAAAASGCWAREIWHDIGPQDLVMIEAPSPPDGMAGFVADPGDGHPSFQFYSSRGEFDREQGDDPADGDGVEGEDEAEERHDEHAVVAQEWHIEFAHLYELPVRDVAAWADLGLPVGGPAGYPIALQAVGSRAFARPDARRLAFLEGLLRALEATTEGEIDAGRWSRTVETADGPVAYRLAIPSLLDEPQEGDPRREEEERAGARLSRFLAEGQFETLDEATAEFERAGKGSLDYPPPQTDDEKAQDLVYRSMGASGRRRTQLLRDAIALSDDCFEAYLYLAEHASRPARSLELFQAGRAAAERALGRERLDELAGRFWDDRGTRLYLRLRLGLALTQRLLGRPEETAAGLREVMALDHPDRSGARDYLLALLLELGRDAEAAALAERFAEGGSAWNYGTALVAYRQRARREASRRLLDAYHFNPLSARFLVREILGSERARGIGPRDADITHEDEDDAEECVELVGESWAATPGATEWMASELKRRR